MRYTRHITTTTALSSAALLALAACAPEDDLEPESDPEPAETETVTETEEPEGEQDTADPKPAETETVTEEPEDEEDPEETEPAETDGPPDDELPPGGTDRMADEDIQPDVHGEIQEGGHFSQEGEEVGVAGLSGEDAPLEVWSEPGAEAEVVGELGPTDAALLGGREVRHADHQPGSWTEVELADGYGWVNTVNTDGSLYYFGLGEDITEEYVDEVPPAEDPQLIAEGVAERMTDDYEQGTTEDGEEYGASWTLVSTPEDHGEDFYRLDVLGMMDDSRAGYRLFATVEEHDDGYQLAQVERTQICSRGVSDDGLCV